MSTRARCAVSRLRLYQFRNYDEAVVRFGPSLNVISGSNAQGKTNLLEAVATLTLTRSPRTATAADLLQWGREQCQIEASVSRSAGDAALAVRFERSPATGRVLRTTTVDGKGRPARAVIGVCPVVMFWPEDLQLVKAGPDGRRRLLDLLLVQLDPRAAAHLARYRRVLEQRNALLHRMRTEGATPHGLDAFTAELVHHGARVTVARMRVLEDLAPLARVALEQLSGGEHVELRYVASHGGDTADDAAVEAAMRDALRARQSEEVARGVTVLGPHRDDVELILDGRPARTAASQGQQRSIVLACKLAEMRYVAGHAGMPPVVLLDDVLSELDHSRRADLLSLLARGDAGQVLVTTTEPLSGLDAFSDVHHFSVTSGAVSEVH